ncbi:enolase-phosphatase E1 isoform X1 [Larus michahellis]|uniref:enolase-phosphatase E1 isoform X1 n=1 Tax=Larus michahellis TaxID=119627 RepID=UPI003D9B8219
MAGRGRWGCSGERRRRRRPAPARKWRRKRSGHRLRRSYIPAPAANQRCPLPWRHSAPGGFRQGCSTARRPLRAPARPLRERRRYSRALRRGASAACSRCPCPPRLSAWPVPPLPPQALGRGGVPLPRAGTGTGKPGQACSGAGGVTCNPETPFRRRRCGGGHSHRGTPRCLGPVVASLARSLTHLPRSAAARRGPPSRATAAAGRSARRRAPPLRPAPHVPPPPLPWACCRCRRRCAPFCWTSRAPPPPSPSSRVVQSDASSVTRRVCPSSSMHRTSTGEGGIESTSADKEDCTNSEYGTRGIPCLGEGIKLAEKCWSRCRRQGMGKSARPAGGIGTNTVNLLLKFAVVQLLCVPPL